VHATGQVAHVDLPADFDGDLARAVNRQLAPSIVVRGAEAVGDEFDARRGATSRHYRYLVWNDAAANPLLDRLAWHVPEPLDLRCMAAATDPLLGEHDFRAFCRRPPGRAAEEPILRRVLEAGWRRAPATWVWEEDRSATAAAWDTGVGAATGLLRFDVVAASFCHQMVRSMVAVLVDAGRGKATAATVMELLAAGSRVGVPQPAPADGLCLVAVGYDRSLG
jgi:tRNA pseudouridine38-40 synthase